MITLHYDGNEAYYGGYGSYPSVYGNVTAVEYPVGDGESTAVVQFKYDEKANGRITNVTDGNGKETLYEYDSKGRIIKITTPDKGIWQYFYDGMGNILKIVDPSGIKIIQREYDSLNRLKTETYSTAQRFPRHMSNEI